MNTRAELEAELKETQELEHYMNTLLDDRIRQCEQLEYTNAALTKRVAELERCMQEVGLLAFMRDATPGDITAHMNRVMDSYAQRLAEHQTCVADLQSQLEAKDKRVAELEAKQCAHEAELAVAHEFIADLQSQLAWTPVSAGLPTEPGLYVFSNGSVAEPFWLMGDLHWESREFEWVDPAHLEHDQVSFRRMDDPALYRRVELPKDGET